MANEDGPLERLEQMQQMVCAKTAAASIAWCNAAQRDLEATEQLGTEGAPMRRRQIVKPLRAIVFISSGDVP